MSEGEWESDGVSELARKQEGDPPFSPVNVWQWESEKAQFPLSKVSIVIQSYIFGILCLHLSLIQLSYYTNFTIFQVLPLAAPTVFPFISFLSFSFFSFLSYFLIHSFIHLSIPISSIIIIIIITCMRFIIISSNILDWFRVYIYSKLITNVSFEIL